MLVVYSNLEEKVPVRLSQLRPTRSKVMFKLEAFSLSLQLCSVSHFQVLDDEPDPCANTFSCSQETVGLVSALKHSTR